MIGAALRPLAQRYAAWLGMDRAGVEQDREEAAEDVRALPLVLRMERSEPPSWHVALALAAAGSAAICLDGRAAFGGPWHDAIVDYCAGHIRKVVRRGRGAQWDAMTELPGLTLTHGSTEVRVLLPGRVVELDKRVAKLQVGGTDADPDAAPMDPPVPRLRIWLPPEPVMTLGKAMAQTGHAGMIAAALLAESDQSGLARWQEAGFASVAGRSAADGWAVRCAALADPEQAWAQQRMLAVRDAGFTEVAPGTVTVIAALEL